MLKIHGRNNSSNVQKVVWALDEMKVPYERIDAGGEFGVVNEEPYLSMNPNARSLDGLAADNGSSRNYTDLLGLSPHTRERAGFKAHRSK